MKGLDSFEIKKEMTLDELAAFMEEKWIHSTGCIRQSNR